MAERSRSSGYSSDPATATAAARREGPSFSSLQHPSQLLQSTPNAKVHRVQRNAAAPTSSSHTATTDSSEQSSLDVSLASTSNSDNDDGVAQRTAAQIPALVKGEVEEDDLAKKPLPVRQYWNNLLLESASAGKGLAPQGGNANAPSTGSSTLVDQETFPDPPIAGPSNLQYQYSQLEQEYERPKSAPLPVETSRRASPLQEHLSRFASASDTRQESSRESSATPQPSLAVARVHDIFARHIHNASSASISRNTSLATSRADRPRQRLRDLLSPSEQRNATVVTHLHHVQAPASPSPKRIRRPISPITKAQVALSASPNRSLTASRQTSWPRQQSPHKLSISFDRTGQVGPGSPGPARLVTSERSISDQNLHTRANSDGMSRLSREWQCVAARSAASESESRVGMNEEPQGASEDDDEGMLKRVQCNCNADRTIS